MVLASSVAARLRGLLLRKPDEKMRLLVPCHDVHTFGMRHDIDIAFLSRDGRVLEVHRNVGRRRRMKCLAAAAVIERFSSEDAWFEAGDRVGLTCKRDGRAGCETVSGLQDDGV